MLGSSVSYSSTIRLELIRGSIEEEWDVLDEVYTEEDKKWVEHIFSSDGLEGFIGYEEDSLKHIAEEQPEVATALHLMIEGELWTSKTYSLDWIGPEYDGGFEIHKVEVLK